MPNNKDDIVLPGDLASMSDADLAALHTRASDRFDAMYGDGKSISDETLAALTELASTIRTLAAEVSSREEAATGRREEATALADQVRAMSSKTTSDEPDDEDDDADDDAPPADPERDEDPVGSDTQPEVDPADKEAAAATVTAGAGRTEARVPKNRRPVRARIDDGKTMKDVAYATTDLAGFRANQPLEWRDAATMLDKRLGGFNRSAYEAAAARGQHMREQFSLMAFRREIPSHLRVTTENAEEAMRAATDISRLPGGALTAAGWCAPSEVLFDLCSNSSRDGLFSLPEIGISRGGIRYPVSPTFADIYNEIGFCFTEEDAIAGNYAPGANPGDPNVAGPKPCYEVPCPDWEESRLEGCGLCITGDIIQMRGYPELMAWYLSNALIAHDHKMSANDIAKVVAGSTAVTMTTGTVGTTAPLLAAIELQAEHIRYSQRMSRSTVLEAVFPYWIHGAIRQDLSVRLGIALFDVTDQNIDAWFRLRGIAPQFVYDWQPLDTTDPEDFTTWPDTVDFLLYPAGTWVRGVDDIITMDNVYDSTQLGMNKFTALFTEEASLIAKRCEDSRVVTVPVCSDGTTHAGILLDCDLAPTAAA